MNEKKMKKISTNGATIPPLARRWTVIVCQVRNLLLFTAPSSRTGSSSGSGRGLAVGSRGQGAIAISDSFSCSDDTAYEH